MSFFLFELFLYFLFRLWPFLESIEEETEKWNGNFSQVSEEELKGKRKQEGWLNIDVSLSQVKSTKF